VSLALGSWGRGDSHLSMWNRQSKREGEEPFPVCGTDNPRQPDSQTDNGDRRSQGSLA